MLQILRALSLDVMVAGLGALALAFDISDVHRRPAFFAIFGLSIWVIYTADHILDAIRTGSRAVGFRHHFHVKYLKPILFAWTFALGLFVYLVFFLLPIPSLVAGLALGTLSLVHLACVQHDRLRRYPKEFFVALIFSLGVWLLPWTLQRSFHTAEFLAFGMLFLSAWSNLLLLALFERREDRLSGFPSEVRFRGLRASRRQLYINAFLICSTAFLFIFFFSESHAISIGLVFLATGLWPLASLCFYRPMKKSQAYRWSGDLVFWLYWIPVLLKRHI